MQHKLFSDPIAFIDEKSEEVSQDQYKLSDAYEFSDVSPINEENYPPSKRVYVNIDIQRYDLAYDHYKKSLTPKEKTALLLKKIAIAYQEILTMHPDADYIVMVMREFAVTGINDFKHLTKAEYKEMLDDLQSLLPGREKLVIITPPTLVLKQVPFKKVTQIIEYHNRQDIKMYESIEKDQPSLMSISHNVTKNHELAITLSKETGLEFINQFSISSKILAHGYQGEFKDKPPTTHKKAPHDELSGYDDKVKYTPVVEHGIFSPGKKNQGPIPLPNGDLIYLLICYHKGLECYADSLRSDKVNLDLMGNKIFENISAGLRLFSSDSTVYVQRENLYHIFDMTLHIDSIKEPVFVTTKKEGSNIFKNKQTLVYNVNLFDCTSTLEEIKPIYPFIYQVINLIDKYRTEYDDLFYQSNILFDFIFNVINTMPTELEKANYIELFKYLNEYLYESSISTMMRCFMFECYHALLADMKANLLDYEQNEVFGHYPVIDQSEFFKYAFYYEMITDNSVENYTIIFDLRPDQQVLNDAHDYFTQLPSCSISEETINRMQSTQQQASEENALPFKAL